MSSKTRVRSLDLMGQTFGKLEVVRKFEQKGPRGEIKWLCRCECGEEKVILAHSLRLGRTTSCGCVGKSFHKTHGMERTRIYNTWAQMLARCNNPNSTSYKNYGAKGIKVCDRWRDFRNFYADMGDKQAGQTLDRIDTSKGYEPGNVRWATWTQQNRNKPSGKLLMWCGKLTPMAEVAELAGVKRKVLENRIRLGMSVEDATRRIRYNRWNTPMKAIS